MSVSKGIVISVWNGIVNFIKAKKAGFVFALIRLGYGSFSYQIDEYYERNREKAKAAGLKVGAYWQTYARTARMARVEAAGCIEVLNDMGISLLDLPIFVKANSTEAAKAFCGELQAAGYNADVLTVNGGAFIDGVAVDTTEIKIKSAKKTAVKQPVEAAESPVTDEKDKEV